MASPLRVHQVTDFLLASLAPRGASQSKSAGRRFSPGELASASLRGLRPWRARRRFAATRPGLALNALALRWLAKSSLRSLGGPGGREARRAGAAPPNP